MQLAEGLMPLTRLDVDGVVAIGVLPLVTHMTPYPLYLKNPLKQYFEMTSLYLNNRFKDYYSYRIGLVNGYNLNLFTNLDPSRLKDVFAHFLMHASREGEEVGIDNRHLIGGGDVNFNVVATRLNENSSVFKFDHSVLTTFGRWVNNHFKDHFPDKELLGSIIKMGQKDPNIDLKMDCLVPGDLRHSSLHLGFNFTRPDFLALKSELFAPSNNCKVYHPLGLVNLVTLDISRGDVDEHFALLRPADLPNSNQLNGVKVYVPDLKNSRTPTLRSARSKARIASHKALGRNCHMVDSPFRVDCELSHQLARSYAVAIDAIKSQRMGTLRFEYIFDSILDLDPPAIQTSIEHHLNANIDVLTRAIPVADIPFDQGVDQALDVIATSSPYDLPKLVCAESYVGFLVDGAVHRVYYDGLKAALSSDVNNAMARTSINGLPMVLPSTPDFSHVNWDNFDIVRFSKQLSFHLYLSDAESNIASLILSTLSMAKPECLGSGNRYEGTLAITVVLELMGASLPDHIRPNLRAAGKEVVKSIGYYDLARCLLYPRIMRGRGNRGLQLCILLSHLYDYDPNLSDVQRKVRLTDLLGSTPAVKEELEVWPLGDPIYSQNTLQKFARVSEDKDNFHFAMGALRNYSPYTELATHLNERQVKGWADLPELKERVKVQYRSKDPRRKSLRSVSQQTNFGCLWLLVTMTAAEQQRLNRPQYHLRIDRLGCQEHFTMLDRHLAILTDFGLILEDASKSRPGVEYLFNYHYVPPDFSHRLANFLNRPASPPPRLPTPPPVEVPAMEHSPPLSPQPLSDAGEPPQLMEEGHPEPEQLPLVQDGDPLQPEAIPLDVVVPPPPIAADPLHWSAQQPRVPNGPGGRLRHRQRFCRPRVIRDPTKPDSHRRLPRNRQL